MDDLNGRIAVITGAASGIGNALAHRFADAGMKLALVDIEADPLSATAEALRKQGSEVLARVVDVSDGARMDTLGEEVLEHFGAVHVVCNNAGVAVAGPMWELSTEDWEFALRPNLWGVIHGVRVFAPHLVAQGEGHIVNTASSAGLISVAAMGPYNVTKQGVVALSETLYGDLQAIGSPVGVSVLCPGFVQTRIWDSERNRPDELRRERPSVAPELMEALQAYLRGLIEKSMPAEAIAEAVHHAILNGRFYVLTHKSTAQSFKERADRIIAGENPVQPSGGPETFSE